MHPSDVSPSASLARMLPVAMVGAHVLLHQLSVLEHAGASVAAIPIALVTFMDFATFAVEFPVGPEFRRTVKPLATRMAPVRFFSRVQIHVIFQIRPLG